MGLLRLALTILWTIVATIAGRSSLTILWTIVATTVRRLFRGQKRAGWTLAFELAVAITRAVVSESVNWSAPVFRRRFLGVPVDRKLRSRIVRASAPLAGVTAETFTPLGWTDADPTVLYFHGGSYVVGSPATHSDLIAGLAVAAGARAVAIAYRKAPEHRFPAAVDDAEAAYRALLAINPPPARLFLAGDSAGGGLALAVALRAREAGLPLPCALLLLSPWTDLECAGESIRSNAPFDYLTAAAMKRATNDYLQGTDARDPLASAIHADLRGLPPLFIETGGAELLLSDNQALAARATGAGVPVVHHVEPDMVHVFPAFRRVLPRPGQAALDRLGAFVRRQAADAARSADVATLRTAT